jgi:hypothetical protein
VDQYTSANKYVGQVPNATVLHNRGQVYTGDADSVGGDLAHPPTHAEVIQNVKDAKNPPTEGFAERSAPAALVANSLAEQDSALGSDPGGWGPQPGAVDAPVEADAEAPSEAQGGETPSAEVTTPAEPQEYPDGEPTTEWTRKQLDAYAAAVKGLDTTKLESKAAVLAAINAPKE